MTPPTIKELCEKATPGPWVIREMPGHPVFPGAIKAHICAGSDDPRVGVGNSFLTVELGGDGATSCVPELVRANAQLIARCSPSTMLVVVEALERAFNIAPPGSGAEQVIRKALNLLNGKAP